MLSLSLHIQFHDQFLLLIQIKIAKELLIAYVLFLRVHPVSESGDWKINLEILEICYDN